MSRPTFFDTPLDSITYDLVDTFLSEGLREGTRIEYKAADKGHIPDSTLESLAAMSNGLGGIILVGVTDNKSYPKAIDGWPNLPRLVGRADQEDATLNKIATDIDPPPRVEVKFVAPDATSQTGILVIRVGPGPRPPYWCRDKGILIRHGDQDRIADLTTIQSLFERRTDGDYTRRRAEDENWFAPLGKLGIGEATIVRAVVGPVDPVPRPLLARALDGWANHLLFDAWVPLWHGTHRTYVALFTEDSIQFVVQTDEQEPHEMFAYSDGLTRWMIPLPASHIGPMSSARVREPVYFSQVRLIEALHTSAALGIAWARKASPDYQGALSYEVEVYNLPGKQMRTSVNKMAITPLGFSAASWKAAVTFTGRDDYLHELKRLYYGFLRSAQAPILEDEGNGIFDHTDVEWPLSI